MMKWTITAVSFLQNRKNPPQPFGLSPTAMASGQGRYILTPFRRLSLLLASLMAFRWHLWHFGCSAHEQYASLLGWSRVWHKKVRLSNEGHVDAKFQCLILLTFVNLALLPLRWCLMNAKLGPYFTYFWCLNMLITVSPPLRWWRLEPELCVSFTHFGLQLCVSLFYLIENDSLSGVCHLEKRQLPLKWRLWSHTFIVCHINKGSCHLDSGVFSPLISFAI